MIDDGGPVGGNPLDQALWAAPGDAASSTGRRARRLGELPVRPRAPARLGAGRTADGGDALIVTKGAPEAVLARCARRPRRARRRCSSGCSPTAAASSPSPPAPADGSTSLTAERRARSRPRRLPHLRRPAEGRRRRRDRRAWRALGDRGEGHHRRQRPRRREGLRRHRPRRRAARSPAPQLDALDDAALAAALPQTTIFARVTPEQKSRIIKAQRALGDDVGFLGDGVNDAVALHDADVGISVDTATDVAKDAADIVLLDKDLGVLADGVVEGRRIFANTIKYVLMAHLVELREHVQRRRRFAVPQLPADAADADPAQQPALRRQRDHDPDRPRRRGACCARPARLGHRASSAASWSFFGPISSLFDFAHVRVMLAVFNAGHDAVPHRLVRRVARHPDASSIFVDPHPPRPVLPQPAERAPDASPRSPASRSASLLPFSPLGRRPRLHRPAGRLLRGPRRDDLDVPAAARARQAPLLPPGGRRAADGAPTPAARAPDPSPRLAVERSRPAAGFRACERGQPEPFVATSTAVIVCRRFPSPSALGEPE